jgi:hypothetical protein
MKPEKRAGRGERVVSRVLCLLLHLSERPTRRLWGWSLPAIWPCTGGGLPQRRLLPSGFTLTLMGRYGFCGPIRQATLR